MISLLHLRSLVAAFEHGALSRAAAALGLSQPAVSQHLAQLEKELGEPLLIRSRQGVRPTRAGQIAAEHGARMLAEMTRLTETVEALRGEVSGHMRISTNILFSQTLMLPVVAQLRRDYPRLKLDLVATDEILDVERENIDLALRANSPGNGAGVVRKVAELDIALVATPDYLDRIGRPGGPDDLHRLAFIQYRDDPDQSALSLNANGVRVDAPVVTAFAAQSPNLVMHAVETGLGFSPAPRFFVEDQIARGTIEEVLPGYTMPGKPVYLVQRAHTVDSPRNRLVRGLVLAALAEVSGVHLTAPARNEAGLAAAVAP